MLHLATSQDSAQEVPAPSVGTTIDQAAGLLVRYPHLSTPELARLIELYRSMSALDTAQLISDTRIGPKMTQFRAENRSEIRVPFHQYSVFVFIAVAGFATIAWALLVYQ